MPPIYDRSTRELLADAASELTPPFTTDAIVSWFAQRFPKLKRTNVAAHIRFLTANDRNRQHHAYLGGQEPLLFRTGDGHFVPYDRSVHGEWDTQGQQTSTGAGALDGFTPPVPFNADEVRNAPDEPGVHVVFDHKGAAAFVGRSGRTRQRLRDHLSGDRDGSALRAAVGRLLDRDGTSPAVERDVTGWIEECTVSWLVAPADQTRGIKGRLVADLAPRLNTLQPPPAPTVWWVNQQNSAELADGYAFAPLDRSAGHQRVEEMQPGDVVLHNVERQVIAAGKVISAPVRARAEYRPGRPEDGFRVEVDYRSLHRPVRLAEVDPPIDDRTLIASDGALSRVYAVRLAPATAARFAREFADRWPEGIFENTETPADSGEGLVALLEQWRTETGYPTAWDEKYRAHREEMAPHFTVEGLDRLSSDLESAQKVLNRFAGTVYGSPGSQPEFNRQVQDEGTRLRVLSNLRYLLHGDGDVADRIDALLTRPDLVVPGFKESLITKALAIADPGRWFPMYVARSSKRKGKDRAIELLGLPTVDAALSVGARAVATNDLLDEVLTPHLDDDPWGKQAFCSWLVSRQDEPSPSIETEPRSLDDLARSLYVPKAFLARAIKLLDDRRQVVFYGPPGTGKTYVARQLAEHVADAGVVTKVQFHPSYAYEDFVEGYRPRLKGGVATFELVNGPLKAIARIADDQPDENHVLLIDEINRGNVAKILGELFFLLEYRDEEMRLQYSAEPFQLPKNLFIIATMNTADRSIALVDAALRRRFHFVPFFPDAPPVEGLLRRWLTDHRPEMAWVADLVDRANGMLDNRHLAIGPSHFLRSDLDDEWLDLVWEHSVLPYLAEQFFGDEERLKPFELARLRAAMTGELDPTVHLDHVDPADDE